MKKAVNTGRYYKFIMYMAVVVLINIAGITMFFRADLTANKIYSLSKESRDVVSTLSEPLTVKVFFTNDLPAPYNNIERYLHDLLDEYGIAGNRYFNYQFYNVSGKEDEASAKNRELAGSYGIQPVQIKVLEQDEVKFKKALMGIALIHGDIIEAIPTITSTDGLEYRITSAIRKMNNKISALLRLKDNISVKLFLSSSLQAVAPYMNLPGLSGLPGKIQGIVKKINEKNYGKISFLYLDPSTDRAAAKTAVRDKILSLQWRAFTDRKGNRISADKGYAGIVVEHGKKSERLQVIQAFRLPLFGTQYRLTAMDTLEKSINETIEDVININAEIGYLADHGTDPLSGGFRMPGQPGPKASLSTFNKLVSRDYSVRPVNLKKGGIPVGLPFLMIAGPREKFSDYELYQIDQFLMKGKNLAIFLDPFREVTSQNQRSMMMSRRPVTLPVNTGIEKLLEHYGLRVKKSYVLDENCYKQAVPRVFGGGERSVYYAPIIKQKNINSRMPILHNIKGLVMLKASPVEVIEKTVKDNGLKAIRLFSSSAKSWEISGNVNLNPMFLRPPETGDSFRSMPMAYILEGSFPSYFADKPIPAKQDTKTGSVKDNGKKDRSGIDMSNITGKGVTIRKGKPAKIFLIGTSEILKDNVLDENGQSPNTQFVMNVLDYLNGREENALMRTKSQRFNPLRETSPLLKTTIKTINIAGLPALIVIAGLIVWLRRSSRKRIIQQIFRR
ncbi:ABC-type uncharacterized transport system [bacterium BMS3Abin07]|nr:ABC-type uncharacterized transport system [bacterium BMS3Abin07]GBE32438.1 ABC-type uncharacterized transport system [bacterium BMS3Bbin05]HDL20350.1 hypothetical protein [Nitrospirota bacterium]HDO23227.1 hypothetical protein [Nitrospirota bacterium]HDZ87772.1 hypothetical protein [Nitrospirota bacterium]